MSCYVFALPDLREAALRDYCSTEQMGSSVSFRAYRMMNWIFMKMLSFRAKKCLKNARKIFHFYHRFCLNVNRVLYSRNIENYTLLVYNSSSRKDWFGMTNSFATRWKSDSHAYIYKKLFWTTSKMTTYDKLFFFLWQYVPALKFKELYNSTNFESWICYEYDKKDCRQITLNIKTRTFEIELIHFCTCSHISKKTSNRWNKNSWIIQFISRA